MADFYTGIETNLDRLPSEMANSIRRHIALLRKAQIVSLEGLAAIVMNSQADAEMHLAVCDLLGRLGDSYRRSAEALAHLFDRARAHELVWESAKALAMMKVSHVADAIVPHLNSVDPTKAAAAAWTLGMLGNVSSVEPLRAILRDTGAHDSIRAHGAEALGVLRSRDAVPDLIAALQDSSVEVRYWSAFALGQIGDPEALPSLDRLAQSDFSVVEGKTVAIEASSAAELIRNV